MDNERDLKLVAEAEQDLSEINPVELQELIESMGQDLEASGIDDVHELLQKIQEGESLANGLETKVDGILAELNHLLAALEKGEKPEHPEEKPQPEA